MDANQQSCTYSAPASAVFGALVGAALGAAVAGRHDRGTAIAAGALGGAVIGGGLATYLQNRCEALRQAQAQMRASQLAYGRISVPASDFPQNQQPHNDDNSGVAVTAVDPSMFAVGSDQLSPTGQADMMRLAQAFAGGNRRVLIVGHTDSTGNPEENVHLSGRRAISVARLFERSGIPAWRLYYKGAGDTEPVDTNATEQGRARNRRVEVVELGNEQSIAAYNTLRQTNPQLMQRRIENRLAESNAAQQSQTLYPTTATGQKSGSSVQSASLPAIRRGTRFDFGGAPVSRSGASLQQYVGQAANPPSNSLLNAVIPAAWADSKADQPLLTTSCIADREPIPIEVRSLATGQALSRDISEYMPGLFGTSWTKNLNGNLIGLTHVYVLRTGGTGGIGPDIYVFAKYRAGDQKPTLAGNGMAQTFEGNKGILYRVQLDARTWPLRCMDIVFSNAEIFKTAYGELYYDKADVVYGTSFLIETVPVTKRIMTAR